MNIDVKAAMQKYGLTEAQANTLDKLDGKKDGKINEESVFAIAKKVAGTSKQVNTVAGALEFLKDEAAATGKAATSGVEKSMKAGKTAKKAITKKDTPKTNSANPTQKKAVNPPEVDKMQEMADAAVEYYLMNGSMKGFSFTGFPRGISGLSIKPQYGFDDTSNDKFKIDESGQSVTRKADTFTLSIHFILNGKKYTVKSECEDKLIFESLVKDRKQQVQEEFVNTFEQASATKIYQRKER